MKPLTPCNGITAIILASGKGTRFGQPKAEAGFGGKSFLELVLQTLASGGISSVFTARNYDSPDMLSTLKLAMKDLQTAAKEAPTKAYLVFPVDFPFVQANTVAALLKAHLLQPEAIIRPCYRQHCGHPIVIPVALDLQMDDMQMGLKGIIRQSKLPILDIPVEDPGILRNINLTKDLIL